MALAEVGAHTTAFDALCQRLIVFLPGTCRAAIYHEDGMAAADPQRPGGDPGSAAG